MAKRHARFNREWASIDALRSALIEADLEDLSNDDIADIAATYWEEFKPLAVRYLDKRWADGSDVWQEADERGLFDEEWDD